VDAISHWAVLVCDCVLVAMIVMKPDNTLSNGGGVGEGGDN
jgi:hypothetical protein